MLIFIHGPDTFRSQHYLKKMIEKFKADRDPSGYNVVILDAETIDNPSRIIQEILAVPFLAERRMIVIKNLLVSKLADVRTTLFPRVQKGSLPESNVVVFWEAVDEVKTKDAKEFFARLEKEKYKEHFGLLNSQQLALWVQQEVKARGGAITPPALNFIKTHFRGDMWAVDHLTNQLVAYKESRPIEVSDVMKFMAEKADDNIFNLVDAIVAKQPQKVYKMIREQYRKGEDAPFIFAMLIRQFRILLELRDLFEREDKLTSDAIAKKLSLHPFVVKKSLPLIKRYTMAELKTIYDQLLEFDINTKTGRGGQSVLLDVLVGRVVF